MAGIPDGHARVHLGRVETRYRALRLSSRSQRGRYLDVAPMACAPTPSKRVETSEGRPPVDAALL